MEKSFVKAMQDRRTIYAIGSEQIVAPERIVEIVETAVKYVPSAFFSQSQKVAVLFGERHLKFWSIVVETLRKIVPADKMPPTEERIQSFAAGYGTILYFDDTAITESFAVQFPLYKNLFPDWANHANGMLQFAVWSLLEAEGLGASLQHYNPIIDAGVHQEFQIPASWRLIAQMPFGKPLAPAGEKTFADIRERVRVLGS